MRICVIRNRAKSNERTQKNEEELFVATDSLYLIIFTPTAENPDHDSFMGSLPENYRLSYHRQHPRVYGCIKPIINNAHEGKWIFFPTQGLDKMYIERILSGSFRSASAEDILHDHCSIMNHYSRYRVYLREYMLSQSLSPLIE